MLCCVGRMWLATVTFYSLRKSIRGVHVSHAIGLVSCGGLASVVALAQRCGLAELVADKLTRTAKGSVNAHLKVPALIPAMVAGADLIGDMDLLRPGGMDRLFTGIHALSTSGTFFQTVTFGHVRQLDSIAASLLTELAVQTPLLAGADQNSWVDDTIRATYGCGESIHRQDRGRRVSVFTIRASSYVCRSRRTRKTASTRTLADGRQDDHCQGATHARSWKARGNTLIEFER